MGCYGDGGAIFTNNDQWAALIQSFKVHGKGSFKYDNIRIGRNSRLDTIQAAVLLVKMDAFERYELKVVNDVASWYNKELTDFVKIPIIPEGFYSSWAQYAIQLKDEEQRNMLQAKLKEAGIPTMVYYPKPMHEQQAFEGLTQYVPCPVTVRLCQTILELPIHPYLTKEVVDEISRTIIEILE